MSGEATSDSESDSDPKEALLKAFVGQDCPYCVAGELEMGEYKGNKAVVCSECGSPQAQLF